MANDESKIKYAPIFEGHLKSIECFDESIQLHLFKAICKYYFYDQEPNSDNPIVNGVFESFRPTLDSSKNRYLKNIKNGNKGGAPIGNQNARKQPKTTQNNHDKDKEEDKEKDKEKVKEKDVDDDKDVEKKKEDSKEEKGETTPFLSLNIKGKTFNLSYKDLDDIKAVYPGEKKFIESRLKNDFQKWITSHENEIKNDIGRIVTFSLYWLTENYDAILQQNRKDL